MHKELTINQYTDAYINNSGELVLGDEASFPCILTNLIPGSTQEEDSAILLDPKTGKRYDFNDADVVAEVDLDKIELSDDLSAGPVSGTVISSVWIGDHYLLIVRTQAEEDYVCQTEYNFAEGDIVSVSIKKEDIKLRLKGDLESYEVK